MTGASSCILDEDSGIRFSFCSTKKTYSKYILIKLMKLERIILAKETKKQTAGQYSSFLGANTDGKNNGMVIGGWLQLVLVVMVLPPSS